MAGRKQQYSPVGSPWDDSDIGGGRMTDKSCCLKDQDRFLPIANVSRIMKKALPTNAKISKEAKETVQGCVSEFISFITGEASDKCQREKRKTINGDDLLWAMTSLGFQKYLGHLDKYNRETEEEKNSMARQEEQSPSAADTESNTHHRCQTSIQGAFFSLGTTPSFGDHGRSFFYTEKPMNKDTFYTTAPNDNADMIANKVAAPDHPSGSLWY